MTSSDITPEMLEAGLEYFYGVSPFCDRPANKQEIIRALSEAFPAMLRARDDARLSLSAGQIAYVWSVSASQVRIL